MKAITAEKRKSDIAGPMSKERIYLTFALNNREYGIELLKISKIVGITTPVPMVHRFIKAEYFFPKGILFSLPYYVKGIIRLHEKIVPIIDLRLRLGFQEAEYTVETCIIIVDNYDKPAGIIVDKLLDVFDVCNEEIEYMSSMKKEPDDEIFVGMVTTNNKKKVLLNIDKVLGTTPIAYKLKNFEYV